MRSNLDYTRFMQLLSAGAFGFMLLLFPLELLFPLFGFPLPLILLSLLFVVALAFLGLFLCLGIGRGCQRWGWIGGLFCRCSWVMYGAIIVCAYGEGGSYAFAVDDDCGPSGCARRGWLGIRIFDCRLDLAEVDALDGSGPLLSCVPPSVLDLDKLGTGCNLTVDMCGELDLIAGSVEALVAVSYVRKREVLYPLRRARVTQAPAAGLGVGSSRSNGASVRAR
jgi:hypothetical protein